ncbi:MAG: hypothetical protein WA949_02315 [Phormidesmis sp.]
MVVEILIILLASSALIVCVVRLIAYLFPHSVKANRSRRARSQRRFNRSTFKRKGPQ